MWVALVAFVAAEPVTALVHRFVMHGFGWRLHASHHRAGASGFELNDLYPLIFASITMVVMAAGLQGAGGHVLVPATVGITAYGACYAFVHEVYIHQRIRFPWKVAILEPLAEAHRIHHLWSGASFGMLAPVVPRRLRRRVAAMAV